MSQALQPLSFPLWGSRLIEASAGTGKTWTIAALYLRLVLGHGGEQAFQRPLMPADILVMTFTRAATRELSDRIRGRLLEAAKFFRDQTSVKNVDPFLQDLLASYPDEASRSQAAWRLSMAAEGMDEASIHTIDAWCQRMLKEHAFDSGCLFEEQLEPDASKLLNEAAQDYWRQHCYGMAADNLRHVLNVWPNVQALMKDVSALHEQAIDDAAGEGSLDALVSDLAAKRAQTFADLKHGWVERAQEMRDWLDRETATPKSDWDGRKLKPIYYQPWLEQLTAWAQNDEPSDLVLTPAAKHRLSPDGLMEARKNGVAIADLPDHFEAFEALCRSLDQVPKLAPPMRLHAAACVRQRFAHLKRQAGTFGFADMLHRLDAALSGPQGDALRQRILAQYPVAMLDEFQDTSPLQYCIFDQIYRTVENNADSALLLIGDPKQSIYGFRGADIHSYMAARKATVGRHYVLGTNFRSTQALVEAVNQWFLMAEERPGAGAFMFKQAGQADTLLPFIPVVAQGRQDVFVCGEQPVPAMQVVHATDRIRTAKEALRPYAAACAEQIVTWLSDPNYGFAEDGQAFRPIQPADIAVLVRDGKEAEAVRRELRKRQVASVYLSDKDSVFKSDEAQDMLFWLRAVAAPLDLRLARAAFATRLAGLSLEELAYLASHDEAFDAKCESLRDLHSTWQHQGVLTMLRHTLHLLNLPARWLAQAGGERSLTNYLHLAELLQNASTQLDGELALIRWLQAQIDEGRAGSEEQIVRLESDADLVKVITIHKSKGLEYPVVCMPFSASFKAVSPQRTSFVNLTNEQGERTLVLDLSEGEILQQAKDDRLREDLRLFYVALTRARHALWLGLPALGAKSNSKTCSNPESASGYLLAGPQSITPDALHLRLQQLADGHPQISLQPLPSQISVSMYRSQQVPAALQAPAVYSATFDRKWTIGSFSALVRSLGEAVSTPLPVAAIRPADDELPVAEPDADVDAAWADVPSETQPLTDDEAQVEHQPINLWHRFTKGAVAGNFLHDQLEWLAGEQFDLQRADVVDRLRRHCERAGRGQQADVVIDWLRAACQQTLPGVNASLQSLTHRLPEMEFWLPANHLQASQIDALCRAHTLSGRARPILPERELRGMLMGFADLVFEHDGRYWVLDYKSNHLGDNGDAYTQDRLEAAMAEHRYDVQAAIYMLALHRLLMVRLGDAYEPTQHLGGALYYFLRGIDGPSKGVYVMPPTWPLLNALDACLTTQGVEA